MLVMAPAICALSLILARAVRIWELRNWAILWVGGGAVVTL